MRVTLGNLIDRLSIVNQKIWHLESDIRKGALSDPVEVGRRAMQIRDFNAERVALINALNELDGGFPEVKVNHRSA